MRKWAVLRKTRSGVLFFGGKTRGGKEVRKKCRGVCVRVCTDV